MYCKVDAICQCRDEQKRWIGIVFLIVSLVGVFLFARHKADANRDLHDEFNLLGFIGIFLYLVFSPWQSVEVFGGYFDMDRPTRQLKRSVYLKCRTSLRV